MAIHAGQSLFKMDVRNKAPGVSSPGQGLDVGASLPIGRAVPISFLQARKRQSDASGPIMAPQALFHGNVGREPMLACIARFIPGQRRIHSLVGGIGVVEGVACRTTRRVGRGAFFPFAPEVTSGAELAPLIVRRFSRKLNGEPPGIRRVDPGNWTHQGNGE